MDRRHFLRTAGRATIALGSVPLWPAIASALPGKDEPHLVERAVTDLAGAWRLRLNPPEMGREFGAWFTTRLPAEIALPGTTDDLAKFRDQFRRRVRGGRCFTRPYLGCREFAAEFRGPDGDEQPIERSEDLGLMLLDLDYAPDHSGRGTPIFFNARLENGVLLVPALNPTTGG